MTIGTLSMVLVFGVVVILYGLWERSDRRKEGAAAQVAQDVRAMGEVVAASLNPLVDPDRCIGSGACVAACPEKQVIAVLRGKAELVNPLGCIGHGACATACPVQAISLVFGTKRRGIELPVVDQNFQTNQPGVYIAGELGGMGLIRNAIEQGKQAADHIIKGDPKKGAAPRRGGPQALDVIVVGAGPAGIASTLRLMEAGLRVLLLDREEFGGTILHYPRAKLVMTGPLELPVYGKIKGRKMLKEQLVEAWQDLYQKTRPPFVSGELVTGLVRVPSGEWIVKTDQTERLAANVVLALGGRGSPRKLGVPGEEQGKVTYRLLEPQEFEGQHVLVVGGGNSAVESAIALADFGGCASVAISYRRAQFARCRAENRRRVDECIAQGSVQALMETEVGAITPEQVGLHGPGGQVALRNDSTIVQIGGLPPAQLLSSFGIDLVKKYGEA